LGRTQPGASPIRTQPAGTGSVVQVLASGSYISALSSQTMAPASYSPPQTMSRPSRRIPEA
jgi:hypothetical protein